MKFQLIALLVSQAATALGAAAFTPSAEDVAECGDLGVMDWSTVDLPADVDQSQLRKCKEHPISLQVSPNEKRDLNVLDKRGCWHGAAQGCTNGYCWKRCGMDDMDWQSGYWCWLAHNYGKGDWTRCSNEQDCVKAMAGRKSDCGVGSCKDCGCGCLDY